MARISSVNVGRAGTSAGARAGVTGIDKRPVDGPVEVIDPGPPGTGRGGLTGDSVCDVDHHGGSDQAVYAYAAEDLAEWSAHLGRPLSPGTFGENLTTSGVEVTDARIGTRWRIGASLLLEIAAPRIPCRTFADWLDEQGWVKTFTAHGKPGAYLRVLEPGPVRADDPVTVAHDPEHAVTVGLAFRALTTDRDLLPLRTAADALPEEALEKARQA